MFHESFGPLPVGNAQYGQQQEAYQQGPPQQQGYPPQQQYTGQQGYPGQQQAYGMSFTDRYMSEASEVCID